MESNNLDTAKTYEILSYTDDDAYKQFYKSMYIFTRDEPFYGSFITGLEKKQDDKIPTAQVEFTNKLKILLRVSPRYFESNIFNEALKNLKYFNMKRYPEKEAEKLIEKGEIIVKKPIFNDKNELIGVGDEIVAKCVKSTYFDLVKNVDGLIGNNVSDEIQYKYHEKIQIQKRVEELQIGVIKHEILHILFGHLFRYGDFANKNLANIAVDIVVNQYIKKDSLIDDGVDIDLFPELKLEKKREAEYYYEELEKLYQDKEKQKQCPVSTDNLNKFMRDEFNHNMWREIENMSDNEKSLLEQSLNKNIADSIEKSKQHGTLPGELMDFIKKFIMSQKKFEWKKVLRMFIQNRIKETTKNSYVKRSRRTGLLPGSRKQYQSNILVAIDTSGSVSEKNFNDFMSEIKHMYNTSQVNIFICECDTRLYEMHKGKFYKEYKGEYTMPFHGRGGTDFNPPIELFNSDKNFDGLIYFTDGCCSPPKNKMKRKGKLLWVISEDGVLPDDNFEGKKIKM